MPRFWQLISNNKSNSTDIPFVTKSGKRDLKWGMELLIPSDAD